MKSLLIVVGLLKLVRQISKKLLHARPMATLDIVLEPDYWRHEVGIRNRNI